MKVEMRALDTIKPYEKNAKKARPNANRQCGREHSAVWFRAADCGRS